MTNKLEEAAKDWAITLHVPESSISSADRNEEARYVAKYAFKAGAKWLSEEIRSLAFPNGTEDQVVRLSDIRKIVGEG